MRILVMLLLDTLPMLGNVLLLCFFVFFIFGIIGVQLWEGNCLINKSFAREGKIFSHLLQAYFDSVASCNCLTAYQSPSEYIHFVFLFLYFGNLFLYIRFICLTIYVHINFSSSSLFEFNFIFEYNLYEYKAENILHLF
jgi:hypothetical protein